MINLEKQNFWNLRAGMGECAGTNDFILKRIEMKLLLEKIRPNSTVLDIGCGNGLALTDLALKNNCSGTGIDFSPEMISQARSLCIHHNLAEKLKFEEGHIPGLRDDLGFFDFVITERCLINLDTVQMQKQAFIDIIKHVRPGGTFLMIEDSHDGLEKLNSLRKKLNLETIDPPWHNTFLNESDVASWADEHYVLEGLVHFSSTYYLLSRVIYAKLALDKKEELKYDSDINKLALDLPAFGDLGAVKLWVWKRK